MKIHIPFGTVAPVGASAILIRNSAGYAADNNSTTGSALPRSQTVSPNAAPRTVAPWLLVLRGFISRSKRHPRSAQYRGRAKAKFLSVSPISMRKNFWLAIILATACGGADGTIGDTQRAESSASTIFLISGQSVSALFESSDETGCIVIDVNLAAASSFQRQPGTGTSSLNQTGVSIEIANVCTGDTPLQADGLSRWQTMDIASDFSSATLTAQIDFVDQFGLTFTGSLSLSFTATSTLSPSRGAFVTQDEGFTVVNVVKGDGANATATGTLSLTGTVMNPAIANAIPTPSFLGSIQTAQNGSITITRRR